MNAYTYPFSSNFKSGNVESCSFTGTETSSACLAESLIGKDFFYEFRLLHRSAALELEEVVRVRLRVGRMKMLLQKA